MAAYFIMMGIPTVVAILLAVFKRYKLGNRDRIVIDSFFAIWLILLMFRSDKVGTDLALYKYHFRNYSAMTWDRLFEGIKVGEFEASFTLISKIVSFFTKDFQWIIIVCAVISVVPIWWFYHKEAKHGYLMIVLFVNIAPFVMYFSGLRQAIAMAFVVPCYYFCKEKQLLKFFITVIVAYLAHNSAFVLLIMYPMYHWKVKRDVHLLYLIPIIGCIYAFRLPIFNFLLQFVGDKYFERYASGVKTTGAYSVVLLLSVFLVFSYLIVDAKKLDDDVVGLRNLLILSVVLQVFSGVHSLAMRMNYYYLLFVPLLIPRIIDKSKSKYYTLAQLSIVCIVGFFLFYYFYEAYTGSDVLNVYPYISAFSNR